jgi:hypothetical protein
MKKKREEEKKKDGESKNAAKAGDYICSRCIYDVGSPSDLLEMGGGSSGR